MERVKKFGVLRRDYQLQDSFYESCLDVFLTEKKINGKKIIVNDFSSEKIK